LKLKFKETGGVAHKGGGWNPPSGNLFKHVLPVRENRGARKREKGENHFTIGGGGENKGQEDSGLEPSPQPKKRNRKTGGVGVGELQKGGK